MLRVTDAKPMNVRHRGNGSIQYTYRTQQVPHVAEADDVSDHSTDEEPNGFLFFEQQGLADGNPLSGLADGNPLSGLADGNPLSNRGNLTPHETPTAITSGRRLLNRELESDITQETIEHLECVCTDLLQRVTTLEKKETPEQMIQAVKTEMKAYNASTSQVVGTMQRLTTACDDIANKRIPDMETRLTELEQRKSTSSSLWSILFVILLAAAMGFTTLKLLVPDETGFVPYS